MADERADDDIGTDTETDIDTEIEIDMEQRAGEHAEMLANRLRKRARHLRKWAQRAGVTCYRLYDRDIPEIPLIVDWYEGRLYVARYERRREVPPAWVEAMLAAAATALDVPREAVYLKERRRQRGSAQYERLDRSDERFVVREGGCRLWVNLRDYLDTGLFLDHRDTRVRVGREAAGARFLNLFCYTGAFTVHAAVGGAIETVSVDLSRTYLDWAEDNLALNGCAGPEHHQEHHAKHHMVREDVFTFLRHARPGFDLAVLDPPTFSNSKKMRDILDIQRDHVELVNATLALLVPDGVLYFSTGARQFKLDAERLRATAIEDITEQTTPEDFRGRRPHRCWRLIK
jgi:23S rRNA (guanine2445-N2)-methyltransferase / 23S rRNA (guanine2069-N7)-methyltransferase